MDGYKMHLKSMLIYHWQNNAEEYWWKIIYKIQIFSFDEYLKVTISELTAMLLSMSRWLGGGGGELVFSSALCEPLTPEGGIIQLRHEGWADHMRNQGPISLKVYELIIQISWK